MGPAEEPHPLFVVGARLRKSVDVIDLEHAGFLAPLPSFVDECAPILVARVDIALTVSRHVPRGRRTVFRRASFRGLRPAAKRSLVTFSMSRSTAFSRIAARSPEGMRARSTRPDAAGGTASERGG
jgi:hypothetical protein